MLTSCPNNVTLTALLRFDEPMLMLTARFKVNSSRREHGCEFLLLRRLDRMPCGAREVASP
jgi:hypothetical protein